MWPPAVDKTERQGAMSKTARPVLGVVVVLALAGCALGGAHSVGHVPNKMVSFEDTTIAEGELYGSHDNSGSADDAFYQRLAFVTAEEIQAAVDEAAEKTGVVKDWLLRAVYITSQWGSLDSLDKIKNHLLEKEERAIVQGGQASLSDVMYYLYVQKCDGGKKNFGSQRWYQLVMDLADWHGGGGVRVKANPQEGIKKDTTVISRFCKGGGCVFLLDDLSIARADPATLRSPPLKLVIPYGWVGGLTAFTQVNYRQVILDIAERMATIMGTKSYRGRMDEVVDKTLMTHFLLRETGINLSKVEWISKIKASEVPERHAAADIAANLRPKDMDLNKLHRADEAAAGCWFAPPRGEVSSSTGRRLGPGDYLSYLLEYSTIVTIPIMSKLIKATYAKMVRDAKVQDGARMLFCNPDVHKSSNFVYHLMFMITPADRRSLFFCNGDNPQDPSWDYVRGAVEGSDKKAIVYLVDDLSLSGVQQNDLALSINGYFQGRVGKWSLENAQAKAVPLMFTDTAEERFRASNTDVVLGYRVKEGGHGSWMLMAGFRHGSANVVLPYMSPDNNNLFFALNVAPSFTFKQCGIKNLPGKAKIDRIDLDPRCAMLGSHGDDHSRDDAVIDCIKKQQLIDPGVVVPKCYEEVQSESPSSTESPQ